MSRRDGATPDRRADAPTVAEVPNESPRSPFDRGAMPRLTALEDARLELSLLLRSETERVYRLARHHGAPPAGLELGRLEGLELALETVRAACRREREALPSVGGEPRT